MQVHRRRRAGDLPDHRRAGGGLRAGAPWRSWPSRRNSPFRCGAAGAEFAVAAFGAALHLGEILRGNIGAADRLDFTAIGPAVNLVSRLEGLCRPLGRSVLILGAIAAETTTPLVPLGEHVLRGITLPCAVFTLPG